MVAYVRMAKPVALKYAATNCGEAGSKKGVEPNCQTTRKETRFKNHHKAYHNTFRR